MAYQITKKDKQITKMYSLEYAIRIIKELKLNLEKKEDNDNLIFAITVKLNKWTLERLTRPSRSYLVGGGINRAIILQEAGYENFNTVDELLEKAEKLINWFDME